MNDNTIYRALLSIAPPLQISPQSEKNPGQRAKIREKELLPPNNIPPPVGDSPAGGRIYCGEVLPMDEMTVNAVFLRGVPAGEPVYSHQSRNIRFYQFPLEVQRLSGRLDTLPVVLRESQLPDLQPSRAGLVELEGELRSFNNRSGVGHRLAITVYARELRTGTENAWENRIRLRGTLCKAPVYRTTPLGREICDMMVAVNRPYGRSDYLPCIAWGRSAREAGTWAVGQRLALLGRVQSREYRKLLPDGSEKAMTAYEVSACELTAEE